MNFPSKIVENAVEQLAKLPGIGRKSALRLVLHMLKQKKSSVEDFGNAFIELINNINYCSICYSICSSKICEVCTNPKRDKTTICVVEDIRVMIAIENTMQYNGVYHILGGLISPIDGVSPSDIRIKELIDRIEANDITEIIFAVSTTMEGDTTNFYIYKQLTDIDIKITTISRGVSVGNELEYTDEVTLGRSIVKRIPFENSLRSTP